MPNMRNEYQRLYRDTEYGKAKHDMCPGFRWFDLYWNWLRSPVIDVGCGTGETVEKMREHGFNAHGIDWIRHNPKMLVGNITKPQDFSRYKTATCIDVLEHIAEGEQLDQLLANLAQTERQVVSIHTGPSHYDGSPELHITQRSVEWWVKKLRELFEINKTITLQPGQRWMFWTETK